MELTTHLRNDIQFAKQGDIAAFERLIKKTQNMVSSIALAIVKDFDQSEDVTQQVFIAAWKNLSTLKNDDSFLPWIRQTTRYTALNNMRENKNARKASAQESELLLEQLTDDTLAHEDFLSLEQQNNVLRNMLEKLPDENKELILLYYREEQSTKQVANLLDLTPDNVRQKLARSRKLLKQELLDKCGKMLLSTAPSAVFSSLIIGAITHASPAAAATTASTLATGKTGFFSKFLALLGGAMIGALSGAAAVFYSMKKPLQRMTNEEDKVKLKKQRNQTIAWVIFSGLLLTAAYELGTSTTIIAAYVIFAIGLFIFTQRSTKLINRSLYGDKQLTDKERKKQRFENICAKAGMVIGLSSGFAALIMGLINNGQLVM